jgi:hypothetical protein
MHRYQFQRVPMMLAAIGMLIVFLLSACAGVSVNSPSNNQPATAGTGTPTTSGNPPPGTQNPGPGATPTQSVFKQGSIDFTGTVQSVNGTTAMVTTPDGTLLTINVPTGQSIPTTGPVKVVATANADGTFTASKFDPADPGDLKKPAQYVGVTLKAVGPDNVLTFNVGTHRFNFTITPGTTKLADFNNNPQAIQADQPVKVTVQFNGPNATVLKVQHNGGS